MKISSNSSPSSLDDSSVPIPKCLVPPPIPEGFTCITEGGARVLFKTGEVFYNPVQILNRDISTLALRVWDARRCANATPRERTKAYTARGLSASEAAAAIAAAPASMPPLRIMEALSASGLRSLRYAAELPPGRVELIVANDLEPTATEAIRRNAAFNGHHHEHSPISSSRISQQDLSPLIVESTITTSPRVVPNAGDASLVMHLAARGLPLLPGMSSWMPGGGPLPGPNPCSGGSKGDGGGSVNPGGASHHQRAFFFDNVDLDPYGSASPFLDAALECIGEGGLLAVTCTDMAVLAGNHVDSCRVKYGSLPVKGKHFGEQALRILLACIETAAARQKKTVTPLASVCVDFYVRIFVTVHTSASRAAQAPLRLGMIHQCTGCDSWWLWPLGRDKRGGRKGVAGGGGGKVGPLPPPSQESPSIEMSPGVVPPPAPPQKRARDETYGSSASASAAAAAALETSTAAAAAVVTGPNLAPDLPSACPHCGRGLAVGGPLWIDPIHDPGFVADLESAAVAAFGDHGMGSQKEPLYHLEALAAPREERDGGSNGCATVASSRRRLLGVLHSLASELHDASAPLYYDIASLCSKVKSPSVPSLWQFRAGLENAGYKTSGSHAAAGVVKTNAPPAVIWQVVRAAARHFTHNHQQFAAQVTPTSVEINAGGSSSCSVSRRYLPTHISSLAALPLNLALNSEDSAKPTGGEMGEPPTQEESIDGVCFRLPPSLAKEMEERRVERDKGGGQRFCENPQAGWGPKSRATGAKAPAVLSK